ncbi:MAG: ABC-2 family transporter protein [Anaeromyxobacter sp.]
MLRYLRLLGIQVRASLTVGLAYRVDFLVQGAMSVFWAGQAVVPLLVVYGQRDAVAGWSFDEALVVMGWFVLMKGILEGAVNPSLASVVEHIRKGTLDFVLMKPADAQFLVSTAKFAPWRIMDVLSGLAIMAIAFHRLGRAPGPAEVAGALVLLVAATAILYALWIVVISAAFYVVKIDNLSFLFLSIYDAARWPADVFKGGLKVLFTVVIPLALMTTFPARALLGRLGPGQGLAALLGAAVFSALARAIWLRSIGRYTSAAG